MTTLENSTSASDSSAGSVTVFDSHSRLLWLYLVCALPSFGIVLKFGKVKGLVLYLLILGIWCFFLPILSRKITALPGKKTVTGLFLAAMALFACAFFLLYPLSHSGRIGKGNDRAQALNISIPRLLHHQNPYTVRTYFGNPITPLPGALVLGVPFRVIFHDAAYQNLVWVFALFVFLRYLLRTPTEAFLLWATTIFLSPGVLDDLLVGGDFMTNCIYCSISMTAFLLAIRPQSGNGVSLSWEIFLAAVWGLCLCSRPSFIVTVPFVAAYVTQTIGIRKGLPLIMTAIAVYALLVLPIYLPAPQDFSPLHVLGAKLTGPHGPSGLVRLGIAIFCLLVLLSAWVGRSRGMRFVLWASAICLALPVPLLAYSTYQRVGQFSMLDIGFLASSTIFVIFALASFSGPLAVNGNSRVRSVGVEL